MLQSMLLMYPTLKLSFAPSQEATLLLPSYLAKAEDVSADYEPLAWWKKLAGQLPRWSSAACKAAMVQPSPVAIARTHLLTSKPQDLSLQVNNNKQ